MHRPGRLAQAVLPRAARVPLHQQALADAHRHLHLYITHTKHSSSNQSLIVSLFEMKSPTRQRAARGGAVLHAAAGRREPRRSPVSALSAA